MKTKSIQPNLLSPLALMLVIETISVFVFGVFGASRDMVILMDAIFIIYALLESLEAATIFTLVSLPLFMALPLSSVSASFAEWRLLIIALFFNYINTVGWGKAFAMIAAPLRSFFAIPSRDLRKLITAVVALMGASLLSILAAHYKVTSLKQIIFYINVFLFFPPIYYIGKQSAAHALRLMWASVASLAVSLMVGFVQLAMVFFIPLHTFWMWWDAHFIELFYGTKLASLLSVSNTWFSFYKNDPPTIRIFGLFPDSHSFAIFGLIGLASALALGVHTWRKTTCNAKWFLVALVLLDVLSFILSGTRGVWAAAVLPLIIALAILLRRQVKLVRLAQITLAVLIAFAVMFPVSSFLLSKSQLVSYKNATGADYAFRRLTTIASFSDVSNLGRLDIWKGGLESFIHHPLIGIGIGNFPLALGDTISTLKEGASAHNLYLNFAVETGILGLAAFLWVLYRIGETVIVTVRRSVPEQGEQRVFLAFTFFFGIVFAWILVYNGVDVVLINDKVLLFFVSQLAILYSITKYIKQK